MNFPWLLHSKIIKYIFVCVCVCVMPYTYMLYTFLFKNHIYTKMCIYVRIWILTLLLYHYETGFQLCLDDLLRLLLYYSLSFSFFLLFFFSSFSLLLLSWYFNVFFLHFKLQFNFLLTHPARKILWAEIAIQMELFEFIFYVIYIFIYIICILMITGFCCLFFWGFFFSYKLKATLRPINRRSVTGMSECSLGVSSPVTSDFETVKLKHVQCFKIKFTTFCSYDSSVNFDIILNVACHKSSLFMHSVYVNSLETRYS